MTNTTDVEAGAMTDAGRIPRITPEDVLEVFDDRDDQAEPLTAPEVADALDCSRRTALNKLHTLADDEKVRSKKVGGRSKVWWTPITEPTPPTTGEPSRPEEPAHDAPQERRESAETVEEILRGLDLPGQGAKLSGRIDAVLEMYEYLQAHAGESIGKSALLEVVDEDAVGYASLDSFWNNFVKANTSQGRDTNALTALPGVEEWGRGEYRYTEP